MQSKNQWFAIYTKSRNEKKVYQRLISAGIDAYLPLQKKLKQWSDRKKMIEEPLFRSYMFVNVNLKDYYNVLNIIGVVRYITFEGKAVPIPDKQIQIIKNLLEVDVEVESSSDFIPKGSKVAIMAGPLMGIEGELIDYANKKRVILRIEQIQQSLLINVPLNYLKIID